MIKPTNRRLSRACDSQHLYHRSPSRVAVTQWSSGCHTHAPQSPHLAARMMEAAARACQTRVPTAVTSRDALGGRSPSPQSPGRSPVQTPPT
eukprot:CAMPEP_0183333542 /NCGR_PEP_ID=MMETSP0164_2-20130417/2427_1 /TAXON_ID=221442 /ORGANISM="Coccolithus pelagicus ssp braarudi, Strain PLY182g" /LENGTH=91 /DNA_ID=CAMNT_0025502497 /DNA_START=51 /DNA_END=323 /DNA_ORIENTATION=+